MAELCSLIKILCLAFLTLNVTSTAVTANLPPLSGPSLESTTIVWAANGIKTTPLTGGLGMTSPSNDNQSLIMTLPNIGAAGAGFTEPPVTWMTSWQFHCDRPTTPCDSMFGMCNTMTGQCNCFNQAFGLRCQAANEALQNTGVCRISDPCTRGVCYDDGVSAKCSCPDGYYGDHCQHKMVHTECTLDKMVVNVYPYGFKDMIWDYIPAPKTNGCPLDRMSLFLSKSSSYINRAWSGFAREFLHKGDPCAGDALEEYSGIPGTRIFSREVHVFYDSGRHYTDTKVRVGCQVSTGGATSAGSQTGLPPPQVNIQLLDAVHRQRLMGPVKLGTSLIVKFSINRVNNANIDDLRVEVCTVSDGKGSQKIIVVDNGCVVPPIGKSFQGGQHGTQFLTMVMYSFPHTSLLHFDCRVRLCDSLVHDACRRPRFCASGRRRRSTAGSDVSQNGLLTDTYFRLGP